MLRARFSIAGLMAVVLLVALGIAAFRDPFSEVWPSVIFTLTLFTLATASLGAILHRKPNWIGFAVFGWTALFLSFGPLRYNDQTPLPAALTTQVLKWTTAQIHGDHMPGGTSTIHHQEYTSIMAVFGGKQYPIPYGILQTGNSLCGLFVAGLGSVVGRRLAGSKTG